MEADERHAEIVAALEGRQEAESAEEPEEEHEAQFVEEESDASSEEEEFEEEETSVEAASDDYDEEEVEEGHRVPYERFKQINDRRHELRSELEARERHIEELKQQLSKRVEHRSPEPSYEDQDDFSVFSEEEPGSDDIEFLKQQTREMQVKFATMELEREVSQAMQEYPNVPEEYLWDSLAQDGNQKATAVAAQYSTWVAEVEEAAIARYLEEQPGVEGAHAPPRPSRKQTARSDSGGESEWKPQNTDEAREAMVAYLRS